MRHLQFELLIPDGVETVRHDFGGLDIFGRNDALGLSLVRLFETVSQ